MPQVPKRGGECLRLLDPREHRYGRSAVVLVGGGQHFGRDLGDGFVDLDRLLLVPILPRPDLQLGEVEGVVSLVWHGADEDALIDEFAHSDGEDDLIEQCAFFVRQACAVASERGCRHPDEAAFGVAGSHRLDEGAEHPAAFVRHSMAFVDDDGGDRVREQVGSLFRDRVERGDVAEGDLAPFLGAEPRSVEGRAQPRLAEHHVVVLAHQGIAVRRHQHAPAPGVFLGECGDHPRFSAARRRLDDGREHVRPKHLGYGGGLVFTEAAEDALGGGLPTCLEVEVRLAFVRGVKGH